jgi:predicted NBD/HSP70 family sugar kinase
MAAPRSHLRSNDPRIPVLNAVLATGEHHPTRKELADVAGVSPRSVMNVIHEMAEFGVLERDPLQLGPGCGFVLSIALDSESMRGGLLDANGTLHHQNEMPARVGQLDLSPDQLLERLRELATLIMASGLDDPALHVGGVLRMLGVNVAWPTPTDRRGFTHGRALSSPDWRYPRAGEPRLRSLAEHVALVLGPPFSEHFVGAINDSNADALSVAFDHARARAPTDDEIDTPRVIITVRIGGGLGAAIIELPPHRRNVLSFIQARLMIGTNGYAGELGHLPISNATVQAIAKDPPEGLAPIGHWACSCGGYGHLESLASGTAFARRMQASGHEVMNDPARARSRIRALIHDRSNAQAQHALLDCGKLIGRALANPILMLDPHTVTLTGFLADEQVKRGVQLERGIWGSAIGDTVIIDNLKDNRYAYNAARGAGLAVIRNQVMHQLPRLLRPDSLDKLTFPFEPPHLKTMLATSPPPSTTPAP